MLWDFYWILNLADRQLEVYSHAVPDSAAAYDFRYAHNPGLTVAEHVTPLARPHVIIAVTDFCHKQGVQE